MELLQNEISELKEKLLASQSECDYHRNANEGLFMRIQELQAEVNRPKVSYKESEK